MDISVRPIQPGDEPFLLQVYASTRQEELAAVPWTAEQKDQFLRMQSHCQHTDYQRNYAGAAFLVILRDGRPAGRLYVDRRPQEIQIIDIALLPEHRNAGIGSRLLREILDEGDRAGKPVTIHVERNNPALRLYRRLGFAPVGTNGVYFLMERPAAVRS
jgi:ribosomal protein S18 acetylase RimI-like enzyme